MKTSVAVIAGLALLGAIGCSNDKSKMVSSSQMDRTTAADQSTAASVNSTDREFVNNAAQGGMAEVEFGNLIQQRGSDDRIRNFGKKLVDDHTQLANELKDTAAKMNLTLPTELASADRSALDKLGKLSGAQFDNEFWNQAVVDHRQAIAEFRREADQGGNQALKDFAARSIPTLESHLKIAENKGAN